MLWLFCLLQYMYPKCDHYVSDSILKRISSGGAFTALSDVILDIDGYIIGTAYDYEDYTLRHIVFNNTDMRN